eukprot:1643996-Rhodomonas_salina.1
MARYPENPKPCTRSPEPYSFCKLKTTFKTLSFSREKPPVKYSAFPEKIYLGTGHRIAAYASSVPHIA